MEIRSFLEPFPNSNGGKLERPVVIKVTGLDDVTKTAVWRDPIPTHYIANTDRREGVAQTDTEISRWNVRATALRLQNLPEYTAPPPKGGKLAKQKARAAIKAATQALGLVKRTLKKAETTLRNATAKAKKAAANLKKGRTTVRARKKEEAALEKKAAKAAVTTAAEAVTKAQELLAKRNQELQGHIDAGDPHRKFRGRWTQLLHELRQDASTDNSDLEDERRYRYCSVICEYHLTQKSIQ